MKNSDERSVPTANYVKGGGGGVKYDMKKREREAPLSWYTPRMWLHKLFDDAKVHLYLESGNYYL